MFACRRKDVKLFDAKDAPQPTENPDMKGVLLLRKLLGATKRRDYCEFELLTFFGP